METSPSRPFDSPPDPLGLTRRAVAALLCCAALLLGLLVGGCAYHPMPPARQLERGQSVVGGYAALTPSYVAPQIQGSATYGLGPADIGVRGGTTLGGLLNLAVTPRLYLSRFATLTLDAEAGAFPYVLIDADSSTGWLAGRARLTSTPADDRPIYGGIQASMTHWYERRDGGEYMADNIFMGGLVIGGEIPISSRDLQVELVVVPVARREPAGARSATVWQDLGFLGLQKTELTPSQTEFGGRTFMYSQLSIGMFAYP